jgi:PAS domain S-box-containing protein
MDEKLVKILLVEDSKSDAMLLREAVLLGDAGNHNIEVAGSLQEAIDFFKNNIYHAVLLDLNLPDSSGLDTVQYLKSSQPDVPIVVLTGFEDEKIGLEAVRMGAQDYLVKGKSDGRLISRAVRYAIERKRMEVELRRARDELEIRVEERTMTIRQQSRFLEAYFQHSLTTVIFLDRNFNFLRVNDEFARACQKYARDFPGHNFFDFFPDPENRAIFENTLRTKKPYVANAKSLNLRDNPELGTTYFDWTLVPISAEEGLVRLLILSLKDVTERVEAEAKVLAYQEQLRALTAEVIRAEENERRKLAMDLHDSIGQILAFLKIELGSLQSELKNTELLNTIRNLRQQVEKAIQQTRTLTFEMSPPELYTLGLNFALEELAHRFEAERGLTCSVEICDNSFSLDDQLKIILYRSVRELLVNTAKHSHARNVKIMLGRKGDIIKIIIEDDGIGFDTSRLDKTQQTKFNGFGLFSIDERLKQMGGNLEIQSKKGKGTKVILSVPLGKE